MKFVEYRDHIKSLKQGKQLPTAIYLHRSAIEAVLPTSLLNYILDTINKLNITESWNLLKLYKRDFKITLLNYPDFDTYAYPTLYMSITIDLEEKMHRRANYQKSENPPILHRKETFVLANYPLIEAFKTITAEGEKTPSDIVNLGFVLNVIEDINERTETLKSAWQLSNKLLVVSVMLAGSAKLLN